jgi:hypothetical protein
MMNTDSFRSYDGLVLDGFKRYRINHQKRFAMSKRNHILRTAPVTARLHILTFAADSSPQLLRLCVPIAISLRIRPSQVSPQWLLFRGLGLIV